jgi:hypothetical protein
MKKWLGIMGVLTVLAGCQDSTSDVAVVGRDTDTPPDTIVSKDGVTVEIYRQGHPRTIEQGAVLTRSAAHDEYDRLLEMGYSLDPAGPMLAHGAAPDGRIVDVTWFPATSETGSEGAIVHVRMGREESVHVLLGAERGDDVDPEAIGKGDGGPKRIPGRPCLDAARSLYQACVAGCIKDGGNSILCRMTCFVGAVMFFIYCLFTSL